MREEKNVPGVLIVPNGTSTFSELENQKTKNFKQGFFEDIKAKGGRLMKEADFEAEKKFKLKK